MLAEIIIKLDLGLVDIIKQLRIIVSSLLSTCFLAFVVWLGFKIIMD